MDKLFDVGDKFSLVLYTDEKGRCGLIYCEVRKVSELTITVVYTDYDGKRFDHEMGYEEIYTFIRDNRLEFD